MPKERILIVEDEPALARGLEDCLCRQDYRVIVAVDGASGLERALTEQPDLILLDIMLPKLDGLALCETLRAQALRCPILFLTAKASIDDRVKG